MKEAVSIQKTRRWAFSKYLYWLFIGLASLASTCSEFVLTCNGKNTEEQGSAS